MAIELNGAPKVMGEVGPIRPEQVVIILEDARRGIEMCNTLDELRYFRERRTEELVQYLKEKGTIGKEIADLAVAIKIECDRKLHEILESLPTSPGARTDIQPRITTRAEVKTKEQIMADAGISRGYAQRCAELASLPDEVVEEYIHRASASPTEHLSQAGLIRIARDRKVATGDLAPQVQGIDRIKRVCDSLVNTANQLEELLQNAYMAESGVRREKLYHLQQAASDLTEKVRQDLQGPLRELGALR